MSILFRGSAGRRLSSKLLKQEYLRERLKFEFRKFYGRYGGLIKQYEVSLSWMLHDILILDQLPWLLNRSDFSPISWPWYRARPSSNFDWFPWSIFNVCGMPVGNAYPSADLFPSPFLDLAYAPIVERSFILSLPSLFLTFHHEYPSAISLFCLYSVAWLHIIPHLYTHLKPK